MSGSLNTSSVFAGTLQPSDGRAKPQRGRGTVSTPGRKAKEARAGSDTRPEHGHQTPRSREKRSRSVLVHKGPWRCENENVFVRACKTLARKPETSLNRKSETLIRFCVSLAEFYDLCHWIWAACSTNLAWFMYFGLNSLKTWHLRFCINSYL